MTEADLRQPFREALRLNRRGLLAGLGVLLLPSFAWGQPTEGASAFIEELGTRTIAILSDDSASPAQKLERLVDLLNQATDLALVARLVMGRHWRTATPAQQEEFVRLFEGLIVQTMAERLTSYGGETFTITGARAADERDSVVSTEILRPTGAAPFNVDWRVRRTGDRYAIIDIVAEGISMVVTHRSEVSETVSRRGIEGLIEVMCERLRRP